MSQMINGFVSVKSSEILSKLPAVFNVIRLHSLECHAVYINEIIDKKPIRYGLFFLKTRRRTYEEACEFALDTVFPDSEADLDVALKTLFYTERKAIEEMMDAAEANRCGEILINAKWASFLNWSFETYEKFKNYNVKRSSNETN